MAATVRSVNPATESVLAEFPVHGAAEVEAALEAASRAFRSWRGRSFGERADRMLRAAKYLRGEKARFAGIVTSEMGKPITEAEAEVEKCAWGLEYYAEHAEAFLAPERRPSTAAESYVQFAPLGTVLAIMPWNFPLWQVFRFAAPALMAGNTALLKHASNVPQCALAVEEVFREAGVPAGVFRSLLVSGGTAASIIADPRVAAVTLTGSEAAGGEVASRAGAVFKKTVLELGGSDPFIVLDDADVPAAAAAAVRARYQNTGQSCIAAKRFIVVDRVFEQFEARFVEGARALRVGDPTDRQTQVGPMARDDLRDALDDQVQRSVAAGARVLIGGKRRPGRGYFYEPTVVTGVRPDMAASCEEVFGPVAALLRARDADDALRIANGSPYGLGSSLWTANLERARRMAGDIEAGQVFINGMVASDPRLPFGGVKRSGYGRELAEFGIREFVNIQTVWIGPATK